MALQVWLPLTKDLRQQGLSDVTVTNNGATFNSAGKLGGCYYFNASSYLYENTYNWTNFNTSKFSLCCWYKQPSPVASGNSQMICIGTNSGWNNIRIGLLRRTSNGYPMFSVSDGSNNVNYNFTANSFPLDTWTHITCTYDNGVMKLYLNGVLDKTYTTTITPVLNSLQHLGIGAASNGAEKLTGYLNDVRIYDHCLSPMEVKRISQGLILHYPLNRQGFGQDNLMPNSIEMPVGSANPFTGTWRLAGSSQMTRSRVAISDAPSGASTYGFQSVGLQTGQDASCWGIDGFPRENGTTYTLSAWGRIVGGSSTAAMLGFSVYSGTTLDYGGTYGKAKSSDTKYYGSGAYDYAGGQLNPNGNWTRIYRTFTSTSASDNIYIGFNTAKTGSNVTLQLCGVKLEKGDKMTPWIPNSNESMYTTLGLDGTTEYDCSGFCNNGIRTGTFSWISDTPKYTVSTIIEKGIITSTNSFITTTDPIFSVALWFKLKSDVTYTAYNDLISFSSSSYSNQPFRLEICGSPVGKSIMWFRGPSGQSGGFAVKTDLSFDTWYHTVLVSEGNKQYSYYVNGEKLGTYNGSANSWTPTGNVSLGENINGAFYESDFRIYATALSADDVKSLYQNCATIDADGIIHGQIRS